MVRGTPIYGKPIYKRVTFLIFCYLFIDILTSTNSKYNLIEGLFLFYHLSPSLPFFHTELFFPCLNLLLFVSTRSAQMSIV